MNKLWNLGIIMALLLSLLKLTMFQQNYLIKFVIVNCEEKKDKKEDHVNEAAREW